MTAVGLTVLLLLTATPKTSAPRAKTAKTKTAKPPAEKPAETPPVAPAKTAEEQQADDDTVAAKKYFQWALTLYKQARYSEAIAKFEEAYRLKPHPTIFFNIGRCYEQLGDIPRALKYYRDYLRVVPEAKDRETVTDAITNLERRLREQGVQQLSVLTEPSGARVSVDGRYFGLSPLALELKPGNHLVSLVKDGFEQVDKGIVLSAEKSLELNISLTAKAPATPDVPRAVAVVPPPAPPKEDVVKPAPPPEKKGWLLGRRFTWIAGGVGVAGLAAGIAMGAMSSAATSELRGSVHTGDEAQALADRAVSMAVGANIAYGVAIAGAVGAVVLFFVEPLLDDGPAKTAALWLARGMQGPLVSF